MKTQNRLKREYSAAGVVFKKFPVANGKRQVKFLLGKHSGYHKWVLPKGLIEPGEKPEQTVVREVEEEMGVKARLVDKKPIHKDTYFYWADFKKAASRQPPAASSNKNAKFDQDTRRVAVYQEQGGGKTRVFKTVTFYLLEYVSGDTQDHGWEMEDSGWYSFAKAVKLLAFEGERKALNKAQALLKGSSE